MRVALIEVAAEVGVKLAPRERVELMEELVIAQLLARDAAVSRAVGDAIARLRQDDR